IARQHQGRHLHAVQPVVNVEALHQAETMRHDALIGLPALPRNETEERIWALATAKEQVKELVDERIVMRQRIVVEDPSRHALQQAALEASACSLNDQGFQAV